MAQLSQALAQHVKSAGLRTLPARKQLAVRGGLYCVHRLKPFLILGGVLLALRCLAFSQSVETGTNASPGGEYGPTVTLANRRICTFRATLDGYSPEERAAAAQARLESILAAAKTMLVTTQSVADGIQISLDGKSLFVVTPGDVFSIQGQTLPSKTGNVVIALREALRDLHSLSGPREILSALGQALLGFVLAVALFWGVRRANRWLLMQSAKLAAEKTKDVNLRELRTAGLRSFVAVLRALLKFTFYLFLALLIYALLWYELRCFPYSRPWGDFLRSQAFAALATFGQSVLGALPDLLIIAFILLVLRLGSQVLSRLFAVAARGEVQTGFLDPVIAATTRRILVFLLWVVGAVVAYPYIPGSQSLAFKGVTVFAGVVLSLGSTNVINQIASGLVLIYSRALRVADYVRVGDTEGNVEGIGLCVTRIRTIKNEEVHIANNLLLGAATTNYSRLARTGGLFLSIKVTIGYNTPWRQVEAMLLQAAARTPGLLSEPPPFVLVSGLSDFYVEYELNARLEHPNRRLCVRSNLHQGILDIFNEHDVQIMSPHYLTDPARPQVVPKSNWFLPPATADRHQPVADLRKLPEAAMEDVGI